LDLNLELHGQVTGTRGAETAATTRVTLHNPNDRGDLGEKQL